MTPFLLWNIKDIYRTVSFLFFLFFIYTVEVSNQMVSKMVTT